MRPAAYPFAAIVGQAEMKLALSLAAVDWRLGVLLRGEKGSGKTTAARGLAALLPPPAPFVNLPIGTTEDRLLGGLNLERTMKGDPTLKPGLLAEAHGGVLYIDEVNLMAPHLGDSILDAAGSGVHVVEREGLSATHPAEFVLLGSMNPEEGTLRPQILDRFALSVTVYAPLDPSERRGVMQRRLAFERDPLRFASDWSAEQGSLQSKILAARASLSSVKCSPEVMDEISSSICDHGVRSLRADLAVLRAAVACASLNGETRVESSHVAIVLPLVLAHRMRDGARSSSRPPAPQMPPPTSQSNPSTETPGRQASEPVHERVFAPSEVKAPVIDPGFEAASSLSGGAATDACGCGVIIGSSQSNNPVELDLRATLSHTLRETGGWQPRAEDLHERARMPRNGTRYLFVIDSSGSHAAQQRMRQVKGAISGLLGSSFRRGDEVSLIVFRGASAQVILEPTQLMPDALAALEYLPTGGRTPLAAALQLAITLLTAGTLLILLTDGRANVALNGGDPWQEALDIAREIRCKAIVVDTETAEQRLGQCSELAARLGARYLQLDQLGAIDSLSIASERQRQGA